MTYEMKMLVLEGDRCPFEEWYTALRDTRTRARIRSRLSRVRVGNLGDCKSVGRNASDLRLDFGPGYRLYFGVAGQAIVVLLGGGDKRTQARDIAEAQQIWEESQDAPERFQRDF